MARPHRHLSPRPVRAGELRRQVEEAGWRTWLSYHENHARDDAGRLVEVEARWIAEAEAPDGAALLCEAPDPEQAWAGLAAALRHRLPCQAGAVA